MLHPKGHKDMQPKNSADISRTSYFPRTSNRNSENHQKNEVRCWPFFCLKMPRTSIPADKLGCTYWYFFPRTFSDISRTSRGCPLSIVLLNRLAYILILGIIIAVVIIEVTSESSLYVRRQLSWMPICILDPVRFGSDQICSSSNCKIPAATSELRLSITWSKTMACLPSMSP